jgi:hypothetical protein
MADKKKKDDKGAAGKGSFLPKSIAGVKLPKAVRGKLTELARHPIVADILAAGLVAIAAKLKNEPAVQEGAAKAADTAEKTAAEGAQAASDVTTAVAKRTRKTPAAKPKPAVAESTAKPVTRRARKPAASSAAPAPRTRKAAAPAPAPAVTPKPPTRRKTTESSAAKPRAARRPAPRKPTPPKTSG